MTMYQLKKERNIVIESENHNFPVIAKMGELQWKKIHYDYQFLKGMNRTVDWKIYSPRHELILYWKIL